jgi:hypothetical protein
MTARCGIYPIGQMPKVKCLIKQRGHDFFAGLFSHPAAIVAQNAVQADGPATVWAAPLTRF